MGADPLARRTAIERVVSQESAGDASGCPEPRQCPQQCLARPVYVHPFGRVLQTLPGPLEGCLRPGNINIFGTFGRIREDGDMPRSHLHKASRDCEDFLRPAGQLHRHLPRDKPGQKRGMTGHDAEVALFGGDDERHHSGHTGQLPVRGHDIYAEGSA